MKDYKEPVELTDEEVENANGGMKIFTFEMPHFLKVFLRLIFKTKEIDSDKSDTSSSNNDETML